MIKIAFIDRITGLVQSVVTPSNDSDFVDGVVYNGLLAKKIDYTSIEVDFIGLRHWDGLKWGTHAAKSDNAEEWDSTSFSWVMNLALKQTQSYDKLRSDLYTFIISTSDFPEWKQANLADTWSVLSIKALSQSLTAQEQATVDYIASVRAWKDGLIVERNRVKGLIYDAAVTEASIDAAVASFIYAPIPVV